MTRPKTYLSFTAVTIALLLGVAGVAGTSLYLLHGEINDIARLLATRSVWTRGQKLVNHLAKNPALAEDSTNAAAWKELSAVFDSLDATDTSLQYISVTRNGLTLFNRQTDGGLDMPPPPPDPSAPVSVDQRLIEVGGKQTPLLAFSSTVPTPRGDTFVEVALRRQAIDTEEQHVIHAMNTLFRGGLLVFGLSFAACILVAAWMIRREALSEKRRRQEEHLVFSGVLADGIVHDFRNPMSAMRLDVQMLGRELAKPQPALDRAGELANRITATMDRLDGTFQEFFQMSKPSDQGPTEVNLVDCLHECLEIAAPTLEQANIMVQLKAPPHPVLVHADRAALRRAILNVITNAKQHSAHGDAIRIELQTLGTKALLSIEDNGPGIPREERERIFDMFVTKRPGGTGLGLFLTRTALEGMKGSIRAVDPIDGKGSRFEIILPIRQDRS